MVNNNGNVKRNFEVPKSLNERLVSYAEDQDKSVNSVITESIEQHLDFCSTKSVLKDACESDDLGAESRVC